MKVYPRFIILAATGLAVLCGPTTISRAADRDSAAFAPNVFDPAAFDQDANARFATAFGGDARRLASTQRFAKWRAMTDRAAANGGPKGAGWTYLIYRLAHDGQRARIDGVQGAFNNIPYAPDSFVWGQDDYWASPAELMQRGRGDSEDVAIAKYFSLRALGFDADDMRILIERQGDVLPEAILLVAVPGDILELAPRGDIKSFYRHENRIELYSLNEKYVWLHHPRRDEEMERTGSGQAAERSVVGAEAPGAEVSPR